MTLPSPGAHDDRGLTALATRRPVGVTMVVLSIALFGVISFERLPRNLMPDITYPSVTVRTEYPGAAPIDVETRVSRRLEEVLAQVRNLRRVSSISRAEASDVIIEFAWDTDMSLAIAEVREKVAQAYLPDEASQPTFLRYDPTLDPILQIGIYQAEGSPLSQEEALIHLRLEAEDRLERELESLPGVAGARVRGGLEREVRVDVDEKLLAAKGVTMALISQRIRDENLNLSSGILYEGEQSRLVRTVNEFADLEEIRDIILRRDGTVPIRLGDVGEVSMGFKDPEVITRLGGRPCVKIDIFKEADANLVEVARRVRERVFGTPAEQRLLAEIREARGRAGSPPAEAGEGKQSEASAPKEKRPAGPEPLRPQEPTFLASRLEEGTRLEVMSDQSVFIQSALDDVRRTVITGGLLAIVVLYLFLRSVWFTLAVGLSIPLSVLATFIVMDQSSVSLNMMSLGGLALGIGMLVDNSVVVLESIFRCRQEGDAPRPAAVRGTRLVASAVTASTLTTVAVFFPIVFVEGIAGQVFREQALTVVISLLASLAVALYFIPAMVSRRLGGRGEPGTRRRPVLRRLLRWHRPLAGVRQAIGRIRATCWRRWDAPLRAIWLFLAIVPLALLRLVLQSLVWAALWTAHLAAVLALGCKERLGSGSTGAPSWFERLIEGLRRSYAGILEGALSHRWLVVALAVAAGSAAGYLLLRLDSELIPEVHQGEFTVEIRLPRATRIEETDRVIRPWEQRILAGEEFADIASLTTTIGVEKDELTSGDEGEHSAELLVRLKPTSEPLRTERRVTSRIRDLLRDAEFESVDIVHPVLFTFKTPVEVEVSGYDLETLGRIVEQIRAGMEGIPEVKDVRTNLARGNPEVQVRLDRELLSRYSLGSPSSVGDVIRRKFQGDVASYFAMGDRKVPIRTRLQEADRDSLGELRDIRLSAPAERDLRLRDVVRQPGAGGESSGRQLPVGEGPAEIRRISHQRAGVINANLSGMSLGTAIAKVERVIDGIRDTMPPEFTVGFGGQKEEMDSALESLKNALLLAIFLVYVVMAMQFESLLQPFIIIFSIPLALVGVVPVLYFLGKPLSIVVFIGMIVLAGIVVNNAIVLVDTANRLRRGGLPLRAALVQAGEIRLRPILMTTVTTVLGLFPLTGAVRGMAWLEPLFGSGQGEEIRAPLAITVIAGLVTSTILTLVVIPVLASVADSALQRLRPRAAGGGGPA